MENLREKLGITEARFKTLCWYLGEKVYDNEYLEHFFTEHGGKLNALNFISLEKRKATCIKRWGTDNVSRSKELNEKKKQHFVEKYGVTHPSQIDWVQQKKKDNAQKKYGVDNWHKVKENREHMSVVNSSKEVRDKVNATNISRYGVYCSAKNPEVEAKRKATCLKNLGVTSPTQLKEVRDKVKATNMEKFGGTVSQTKEYMDTKARKISCFGQGFDSLDEVVVYRYLVDNGLDFERDVPIRYTDTSGKNRVYFCDFYVKDWDRYLECKGAGAFKAKGVLDLGYWGKCDDRAAARNQSKLQCMKDNNVLLVTQCNKIHKDWATQKDWEVHDLSLYHTDGIEKILASL